MATKFCENFIKIKGGRGLIKTAFFPKIWGRKFLASGDFGEKILSENFGRKFSAFENSRKILGGNFGRKFWRQNFGANFSNFEKFHKISKRNFRRSEIFKQKIWAKDFGRKFRINFSNFENFHEKSTKIFSQIFSSFVQNPTPKPPQKFHQNFTPKNKKSPQNYRYNYIFGLGGNVGDTAKIFAKFLLKISRDRRFFVCESSPLFKNAAFGYENQPDFLNATIALKSSIYAPKMLKLTQHFERIFGRKKSFKNGPRTLDIDILYFGGKIRQTPKLTLPHSGAATRISVILPLGLMKGQKWL